MELQDIKERQFSGAEVLLIMRHLFPHKEKLNYPTLLYYRQRPHMAPSGEKTKSDYRTNKYTFGDLMLLAFMMDMKQFGIESDSLADVCEYIRDGFNGGHAVDRLEKMSQEQVNLVCDSQGIVAYINGAQSYQSTERFAWFYNMSQLIPNIVQAVQYADELKEIKLEPKQSNE
jgi:hypothetical protein